MRKSHHKQIHFLCLVLVVVFRDVNVRPNVNIDLNVNVNVRQNLAIWTNKHLSTFANEDTSIEGA